MPKYPKIKVKLVGADSNVFGIIGKVSSAMKKGGVPAEEVKAFTNQAFGSGSYDEVLRLVMELVEVC